MPGMGLPKRSRDRCRWIGFPKTGSEITLQPASLHAGSGPFYLARYTSRTDQWRRQDGERGCSAEKNAQPSSGSCAGSGGRPPIAINGAVTHISANGRRQQPFSSIGVRTLHRTSCAEAEYSRTRPPYMTATRSEISAATPISCVTKITDMPSEARSSRIRNRICICTVTSSAVVGSSAKSTFGLQASASAIIAR